MFEGSRRWTGIQIMVYPYVGPKIQRRFATSGENFVTGIAQSIQSIIHRKSFQLPLREKPELEALEPRVLLSADLPFAISDDLLALKKAVTTLRE